MVIEIFVNISAVLVGIVGISGMAIAAVHVSILAFDKLITAFKLYNTFRQFWIYKYLGGWEVYTPTLKKDASKNDKGAD